MSADLRDEVTARVVNELWIDAIDGSIAAEEIHDRVEMLLERVNAESPVVNSGMTTLHALTCSPIPSPDTLIEARIAWMTEVECYEANPPEWMRRYFVKMVRDHTRRHGVGKGRAFASKLVRDGHMRELDVPPELRT
jgi:hypothetical protein